MRQLPSFKEIFAGHIWSVVAALAIVLVICAANAFFPNVMPRPVIQQMFLSAPMFGAFWYVPVVWAAVIALLSFSVFRATMQADWGDDHVYRNHMAKGDPLYGVAGGIAERAAALVLLNTSLESVWLSVFIRALPLAGVLSLQHYNIISIDATILLGAVIGFVSALLCSIANETGSLIEVYSDFAFNCCLAFVTAVGGLTTALMMVVLYQVSHELVCYVCKRIYWRRRRQEEERIIMGTAASR